MLRKNPLAKLTLFDRLRGDDLRGIPLEDATERNIRLLATRPKIVKEFLDIIALDGIKDNGDIVQTGQAILEWICKNSGTKKELNMLPQDLWDSSDQKYVKTIDDRTYAACQAAGLWLSMRIEEKYGLKFQMFKLGKSFVMQPILHFNLRNMRISFDPIGLLENLLERYIDEGSNVSFSEPYLVNERFMRDEIALANPNATNAATSFDSRN